MAIRKSEMMTHYIPMSLHLDIMPLFRSAILKSTNYEPSTLTTGDAVVKKTRSLTSRSLQSGGELTPSCGL